MYSGLIIISMVFAGIGWLMSSRLKSVFAKYSKVPMANGKNGSEIAAEMLEHYNISNVKIVAGQGTLTDHYNPQTKTVSLSPDVFYGRTVAAAAVAAHECGHAVQHATSYSMLTLRSRLVPVVNISAKIQQYFFMLGMVLAGAGGSNLILMVAIAAFAVTALFSVITLPVEFDASNRALAWLDSSGSAVGIEHEGAKTTLWWAAMTYVVAALAAVTQLLYLVFYFLGNRR